MKKAKTFILVFAILIFAACNQKTDEFIQKQKLSESLANGTAVEYFPGLIPFDNKVHDFRLQPNNFTLADVDEFYKNELPRYRDELYYSNLKGDILDALLSQYDLTGSGDEELITFYFNEMKEKPWFHAYENYSSGLKEIEYLIGKSEVERLAELRLNKNIDYMRGNFTDMEKAKKRIKEMEKSFEDFKSDS
jgi:hypothetical protein